MIIIWLFVVLEFMSSHFKFLNFDSLISSSLLFKISTWRRSWLACRISEAHALVAFIHFYVLLFFLISWHRIDWRRRKHTRSKTSILESSFEEYSKSILNRWSFFMNLFNRFSIFLCEFFFFLFFSSLIVRTRHLVELKSSMFRD